MLANIQGLRWFAALSVVVFHAHLTIAFYTLQPMNLRAEAAGVDVFFVISGFIMVHTTRSGNVSPPQFWAHRAIRVAPLYWLATLAAMAIFATGILRASILPFDAGDAITSFLFIPHLRHELWLPILPVGWTLIFEVYFYFLFGLALYLRNQTAAVAALAAFFLSTWAFGQITNILPAPVAFLTHLITIEFAAGCVLGLIWQATETIRIPAPRLIGGGAIAAGVLLIIAFDSTGLPLWDIVDLRAILWGGPAVMIVAGALILERAGIRFTSSFIALLGAASYAIYLVHVVALELVIVPALAFIPNLFGPSLVIMAIQAIAVAVFGGVAVHLWIERPIQGWLRATADRLMKPRAALA